VRVKIFKMLSVAMSEIPRLLPLMRDGRVPLWSKIVAGLIAALVVSPLDLLGDIPILGFLDDGALLLFVLHMFVNFAEKSIA
jgi:uncharacterized membrane protein YkvA (DUF1232 family)